MGPIPASGRSPGEENSNPLQSSCLENPMNRGAWWATVQMVTKSRTTTEQLHTTTTTSLPETSNPRAGILLPVPGSRVGGVWRSTVIGGDADHVREVRRGLLPFWPQEELPKEQVAPHAPCHLCSRMLLDGGKEGLFH